MRKLIPALLAAFCLAVTTPADATMIVYGTISGEVSSVHYQVIPGDPHTNYLSAVTVGMPVTGYFSYDYDLLSSPDSSGLRTVATYINAHTQLFFYPTPLDPDRYGGGLGLYDILKVDTNGLPYYGVGGGTVDIGIYPNSVIYSAILEGNYQATVNYTITGIPDPSATWILLGLGLTGITVAGRSFGQRQIRRKTPSLQGKRS